jgi:hypothetical protein
VGFFLAIRNILLAAQYPNLKSLAFHTEDGPTSMPEIKDWMRIGFHQAADAFHKSTKLREENHDNVS